MRYISKVSLAGFRCYASSEVEIGEITVFYGANNAGKSAFLNLIRRFASANPNRHAVVGTPGGYGPSTSFQFVPTDHREQHLLAFSLSFTQDITAIVSRNPKDALGTWPSGCWPLTITGQWSATAFEPKLGLNDLPPAAVAHIRPKGPGDAHVANDTLKLTEQILKVIPERRALHLPLQLQYKQPQDTLREELFTPDRILPTLLDWQFTAPDRVAKVREISSSILDQKSITIEFRPAQATLLIGLGSDPPRPLEELGSGVAEVLVFALALASADRGLLLYEEPEIHLHPRVQDKLLREMEAACESGWQFLLTTHSEYILSNWQKPQDPMHRGHARRR